MRKGIKKGLSKLLVIAMIAALFPIVKWNTVEVRGEVEAIPVASASDLYSYIEGNTGTAIVLSITENLEIDTPITLTNNDDVTIDLNGHSITGSMSEYMISSAGKLAIVDNGTDSIGSIINRHNSGGIISTSGGTLSVSGGSFSSPYNCMFIENTNATISGGTFETTLSTNDIAFYIKAGNTVSISGSPSFTSHYMAVASLYGSDLTINGGSFTVTPPDSSFGYAVGVDYYTDSSSATETDISDTSDTATTTYSTATTSSTGSANVLTITGGTFTRDGLYGKALFIGSAVDNSNVHLRGGTYSGAIARGMSAANADADYSEYYGVDDSSIVGIIDSDRVLTNNTFEFENNYKIMDTASKVSIVEGTLLKPNTGRTSLENYKDNLEGSLIDYYVVTPVSIGSDGTVYSNGYTEVVPTVNEQNKKDTINYTFHNWMDSNKNTYSTVMEYVTSDNFKEETTHSLIANWKAEIDTEEELVKIYSYPVDYVSVISDIDISSGFTLSNSGNNVKELDLGGHTITYSNATTSAFMLSGKFILSNGTIKSTGSNAVYMSENATLENVTCISDTTAIYIDSDSNKIISGVFKTTDANSPVLQFNGDENTKDTFFKNIFAGSNTSNTSNQVKCDVSTKTCSLNTSKLLVSTDEITYYDKTNLDYLDFGVVGKGTKKELTFTISNADYIGDIVIDSISLPENSPFTVTGDTNVKLEGGSSATYSYKVQVGDNADIGLYEDSIEIKYTKMDGATETISQAVYANICTSINGNGTVELQGGTLYLLESGTWKVNGDATVYSGGTSFYVPTDGNYTFQKQ